ADRGEYRQAAGAGGGCFSFSASRMMRASCTCLRVRPISAITSKHITSQKTAKDSHNRNNQTPETGNGTAALKKPTRERLCQRCSKLVSLSARGNCCALRGTALSHPADRHPLRQRGSILPVRRPKSRRHAQFAGKRRHGQLAVSPRRRS